MFSQIITGENKSAGRTRSRRAQRFTACKPHCAPVWLCDWGRAAWSFSAPLWHLGDDEADAPAVSARGSPSLGAVFQLIQHEEEAPTPKPKMELPQRFRIRPVTPVEKFIKVRKALLNPWFPE